MNYGLVNTSQLKLLHSCYSGLPIGTHIPPNDSKRVTSSQQPSVFHRKSTTPNLTSNFFQTPSGTAVVNQIADSGAIGLKVLQDSHQTLSENDSLSLKNFYQIKNKQSSVHKGYMKISKHQHKHSRRLESQKSSRKSQNKFIFHDEISIGESSQKMDERSRSESPNTVGSRLKSIVAPQGAEQQPEHGNRTFSSDDFINLPSYPEQEIQETPVKFPRGPGSFKNQSYPKTNEQFTTPSQSDFASNQQFLAIKFANYKVRKTDKNKESPLTKQSFTRGTSNESRKPKAKPVSNQNTFAQYQLSNKKQKKGIPIAKSIDITHSSQQTKAQSRPGSNKTSLKRMNNGSSLNHPISPMSQTNQPQSQSTNQSIQTKLKSSSIKVPKLALQLSSNVTPTQKISLHLSARENKQIQIQSPMTTNCLLNNATSNVLTKLQMKTKTKAVPTTQLVTKKLRITKKKDYGEISHAEIARSSVQSHAHRSDFLLQQVATASVLTQNSQEESQIVISLTGRSKYLKCLCKNESNCPQCQQLTEVDQDIEDEANLCQVLQEAVSIENQQPLNEPCMHHSHKSSTSSFLKVMPNKIQHKSAGNSFLQNLKLANEPQNPCNNHASSLSGQHLQVVGQHILKLNGLQFHEKFQPNRFRKPPTGIVNSKSSKHLPTRTQNNSNVANDSYDPLPKQQVYQGANVRLASKFQNFSTQQNSLRSSKE